MLEEIIDLLKSLPPDILGALLGLVKTLLQAKTEADRRAALDQACAVAEALIVQKEFPG